MGNRAVVSEQRHQTRRSFGSYHEALDNCGQRLRTARSEEVDVVGIGAHSDGEGMKDSGQLRSSRETSRRYWVRGSSGRDNAGW
ncbi:hypothetical protein HYQ46_001462 [Verticillium longisporum]|nr:hypothetical protein HYQ46_001462 [Verticillium longisporum]